MGIAGWAWPARVFTAAIGQMKQSGSARLHQPAGLLHLPDGGCENTRGPGPSGDSHKAECKRDRGDGTGIQRQFRARTAEYAVSASPPSASRSRGSFSLYSSRGIASEYRSRHLCRAYIRPYGNRRMGLARACFHSRHRANEAIRLVDAARAAGVQACASPAYTLGRTFGLWRLRSFAFSSPPIFSRRRVSVCWDSACPNRSPSWGNLLRDLQASRYREGQSLGPRAARPAHARHGLSGAPAIATRGRFMSRVFSSCTLSPAGSCRRAQRASFFDRWRSEKFRPRFTSKRAIHKQFST